MGTPSVGAAVSPRLRGKRLLVAAVLAVVLVAAAAAAWYAGGGKYKWCAPYRITLRRVAEDPQVVQRLGQPVRDASWLPSGSMTSGQRGQANLMFRIAGPHGTADVQVQARQVAGQWGGTILVTFGPGDRLQLELGEAGQDEAPRFDVSGPAPAGVSPTTSTAPVPSGDSAPGPDAADIQIDLPP